ncbi:glycosyltransferase [Winogradskyella sp.]|uniref:glycosyltransferase n=1 Tax=Winogradskyella sp. TaxID=1883156 RepID=UPI0025E70A64|nr:glycosyltransferase [Winogradskyella sp.]MBT8243800.1 glycosyltransferase [Winogradskyella sp.]
MSVYKNDNPDHFYKAIQSVVNQTIVPNEIIVVVDGPIPNNTEQILSQFATENDFVRVVKLEKNMGHGYARNIGLQKSSYEYVALMDSDDICLENRFELQLNFFEQNKDISILGGTIEEFSKETDINLSKRKLPETDAELKKYMKYRCPFNQMSVMFKKADVIKAGGYIDWFCNEDYYLWIRMALKNYKFHNLQQTLLKVRTNENFYKRRGGFKYFKSEAKIQKLMFSKDIISLPVFLYNVSIRFIVQVLLTERLRKYFFKTFTRSN